MKVSVVTLCLVACLPTASGWRWTRPDAEIQGCYEGGEYGGDFCCYDEYNEEVMCCEDPDSSAEVVCEDAHIIEPSAPYPTDPPVPCPLPEGSCAADFPDNGEIEFSNERDCLCQACVDNCPLSSTATPTNPVMKDDPHLKSWAGEWFDYMGEW